MPLPKFRVSRRKDRRPEYLNAHDETWVEQQKASGGDSSFRRSFGRVIALCILLLVLVVAAITTAIIGSSNASGRNTIGAADTYAVSAQTQSEMRSTANDFITGMILYSSCSDKQTAEDGRQLALSTMAAGTESYNLISDMSSAGSGPLSPDDISVVVGGLTMSSGTRAYAGTYVYEGRGGAADVSAKDDAHPDGQLIDKGYSFRLSFSQVYDANGENPAWKITRAQINHS